MPFYFVGYIRFSCDLSIADHAFARRMLTSLSIDEMLLLRYLNWYTNPYGLPFKLEIGSVLFKTFVLCFICIHVKANASCLL